MSDPDDTSGPPSAYPEGATALSEEEQEGLKLSWVATRADLNAAEADNITKALGARRWARMTPENLLDDHELRRLHKAMFGNVWTWAGTYRKSGKNIGCDPHQIAVKVRDLCGNAPYWFGPGGMTADEAGSRFHHDLVHIHPFANGNGRHARAAADFLMAAYGHAPFTWGQVNLVAASKTRSEYIAALRAADAGNYKPLIAFVRS